MNQYEFSFGPYRLIVAQRLLMEGDKPVRLGSRAFDILTALVERAGELVSKEHLIARAWPKALVEEANLKIQVSALRRALGDGQGDHRYIATVVGRGYNFVAPIRKEEPSRTPSAGTLAPAVRHNLPSATIRMIGREDIATTLAADRVPSPSVREYANAWHRCRTWHFDGRRLSRDTSPSQPV